MAKKPIKDPMDYIPDKTLYAAVMFARKMIREGTAPGIANTRAAKYYKVSSKDVAHHVGQVASKVRVRKAKKKARDS
jgi:hypothetical protein